MHDFTRACFQQACAASVFVLAIAAPLTAQDHRAAFGVSGGWSAMDDLAPGLATPAFFDAGYMAGVQLEAWVGSGRVGYRLDGSYSSRALDGAPELYRQGTASLDLLIRPLRADPDRFVAPFVAIGAGAFHVDATDGAAILAGGAYGDDPATLAAAMAGIGVDLGSSRRFGLRLEAMDRVILPWIGEGSRGVENRPTVHSLQLQTALQLRAGRISDSPVVVAAAPERDSRPAPDAPSQAEAAAPVEAAAQAAAMSAEDAAWVRSELDRLDALRSQEMTRLESRIEELEARVRESERAVAARPSGPASATGHTRAMSPSEPGPGPFFTVQVGAFVEIETARRWEERLRAVGLPAWITDAVVKGQAVKRVRVGMLPSVGEARALARVLKLEYGWPTWVDRVGQETTVENQTIASTRTFLRGY